MAVPKGHVRISGRIYPTDTVGRITVKDKTSGEIRQAFPVDVNEALAMGEKCPIEILTPSKGAEEGELTAGAGTPVYAFAGARGPAADIPSAAAQK